MPNLHTYPRLVQIADTRGQTMTEMAAILALIVLIAMAGLTVFSGGIQSLWDQLASTLPNG